MPDEERKVLPEAGFSPETEGQLESAEMAPDLFAGVAEDTTLNNLAEERLPAANNVDHFQDTVVEVPRPKNDPLFEAVEDILEEKLRPLYDAMPKAKQDHFRAVADRTTQKLRDDIAAGRLHRHRTMALIGAWLSIIPKVIGPWVWQEKKNRTDALFELQEKQQQEHRNAA